MGKAIDTYEAILAFIGIEKNVTDAEYEEIEEDENNTD